MIISTNCKFIIHIVYIELSMLIEDNKYSKKFPSDKIAAEFMTQISFFHYIFIFYIWQFFYQQSNDISRSII